MSGLRRLVESSNAQRSGAYVPVDELTGGVDVFGAGSYINGPTGPIKVAFGYDSVNNRMWGKEGSAPGFTQSDDGGTTWSANMGIPSNTSASDLSGVAGDSSFVWAIYKDLTSSQFGVYRAAIVAAGTALTWSSQLLTLPVGTTIMSVNDNIWMGSSGAIVVGEYGDPSGGPSLWRLSPTDAHGAGTNWVRALGPISGTRHCHCVREDPFNPHTWYATFGDTGAISLAKSTDDGVTWTTVLASTAQWQGVQISFSAKWIWITGDRVGATPWVLDRATLTPRLASKNWHGLLPVPGASAARTVTDLATTSGSTQATSATAAFVSTGGVGNTGDVGHLIESPTSAALGFGNSIQTVTNGTTVQLASNAVSTATNVVATIWGDTWRRQAYWGAVDPATEIFYFVSNDKSAGGNRIGLFYIDRVGGDTRLLDATDYSPRGGGSNPVIIANGYVWFGAAKHKLIARTT